MIDNIQRIQEEAHGKISEAPDLKALDRLRVEYLGKKGTVTSLLHKLGTLEPSQRREVGAAVNKAKNRLEEEIENRKAELGRADLEGELSQAEPLDVTLPGQYAIESGSFHPLSRVTDQMVRILRRVGFSIAHGPEAELEFYNFEALNTPEEHPARDEQDTFYFQKPVLLRSHTSPVQIRAMQSTKPPIQVISLGKVYRSDYDHTHTPMFHQMEGLYVDKNVSMADLKGVLLYLIQNLFGDLELRFRPSFFPFTEPSAEVDMQCIECLGKAKGCRLCSQTGWLEIGGCGMVHPNVFNSVDYDADEYTGYAFGMGIERITMLKYGITDIRMFFENDYRLLEQF